MSRIAILGINFAPETTGIGPYTTAIARHLAIQHEVRVVTGFPHYPSWEVKPGDLGWRRFEQHGNIDVIRLRHYVPRKQSVIRRATYDLSYAARAAIHAGRAPVDAVIAVVPALFSPFAARIVAHQHDARLGIIVQDMMGKAALESGLRRASKFARAVTTVERLGLTSADQVAVINDRFAQLVHDLGVSQDRISIIRNWVHIGEPLEKRHQVRKRMGWGKEIVALHSGNMGLKQDLGNVIAAAQIADQRSLPVRFVLMGDGNQRESLQRLGSRVARLDFVPPVTEDYAGVLAAADVLILNERQGLAEMSLPSKLTSYFSAGRPIVAATEWKGAAADLLRESQGGIIVSPGVPEALIDAVMMLNADEERAAKLGCAGRQFAAAQLSEDVALEEYSKWVDRLLSPNRKPLRS